MIYFLMYLLTIIDNVIATAVGLSVCLAILLIIMLICFCVSKYDSYSNGSLDNDHYIGLMKKVLKVFIAFICLATFIPSQKGLAFVVIAPQIIENGAVKETVKNIPELTQLGTEYLKDMLKEKVNAKN